MFSKFTPKFTPTQTTQISSVFFQNRNPNQSPSFSLYDLTLDTSGVTEEQVELRESVFSFAQEVIAPRAAEFDENGKFPEEMWPLLGEMGLLGITAPEEYGGLGLGYTDHLIAMEELSRASASIALSYAAHSQLCVNQITKHGTEDQKQKWLPGLIDGSKVGALAMSEPDAGSDVVSMKTKAVDNGDHFLISGSKLWITNGADADVMVMYAKTNPEAGSKGITAFLIEKGMEGFTTEKKLEKLGMRASNTYGLAFDQVIVPKENVLGQVGSGVKILMSGLDSERLVLSAGPLGIMRACLDAVVPYCHERKQFNTPIGQFQLMQGTLAEMYSSYQACRAFVYSVSREFDKKYTADTKPARKDCAAAILYTSEKVSWMTKEAVKAMGGNGYIEGEYPVSRLYRDALLYEIGAGTTNVRKLLIGRELFNETV